MNSVLPLQTIRRSEVPLYLQKSQFFLSLGAENGDEISIPENCIKRTTKVTCNSDLDHLLSTVRFWIVDPLPREIVAYVANSKNLRMEDVIAKYKDEFPNLFNFVVAFHHHPTDQLCVLAARCGCVEFLKYFTELKKPLNAKAILAAAEHGHVDCMSYCADFLLGSNSRFELNSLDWSKVIEHGHVSCLKYLVAHRVRPTVNWCYMAAGSGQLTCLQYLLHFCGINSLSETEKTSLTIAAAKGKHLNCLKYLVELGCAVTDHTWAASMTPVCTKTDKIAVADSTSVVASARMNSAVNVTPLVTPPTVCDTSISLHCLKYLLDNVLPPPGPDTLVNIACKSGNINVVRYLHQREYTFGVESVTAAAQGGSYECLQYVHDEVGINCYVPSTMASAAGAGQLELVKQLHEKGCVWDDSAILAAIEADQPQCLKFLLQFHSSPASFTTSSNLQLSTECRYVIQDAGIDRCMKVIDKMQKELKGMEVEIKNMAKRTSRLKRDTQRVKILYGVSVPKLGKIG